MTSLRRAVARLVWTSIGCIAISAAVGGPMAWAAVTPPPGPANASINDTSTTRRIQLLTAGLALAGVALAGVTVWFWRNTRPDPEALGSLDVMSQRSWRRQDVDSRYRALAGARPGSSVVPDRPAAVDLSALAAARALPSLDDHAGFGDLVEASVPAERADGGAEVELVELAALVAGARPDSGPVAESAGAVGCRDDTPSDSIVRNHVDVAAEAGAVSTDSGEAAVAAVLDDVPLLPNAMLRPPLPPPLV